MDLDRFYLRLSDPSPHRQQVGLSDSPEKRESDDTVSLTSAFIKCSGLKPLRMELQPVCFMSFSTNLTNH